MLISRISQVTSKKSLRRPPSSSGRLQSAVMKSLDEMVDAAKRIKDKRKPYSPGSPSGRLAADYPIRCMDVSVASADIGALFFEEPDDASRSFWVVSSGGEKVEISVDDLFPSGKYDISQVRSVDFARVLEGRLTKDGKPLEEAKRDLLAMNSAGSEIDVSEGDVAADMANVIVCDSIPLNDFERELVDRLREAT